MNPFIEIIENNKAWLCLDCGKCSSVCPITVNLVNGYTSPRLLVETAVNYGELQLDQDPLLWSCLTCQRCSEICPSEVDFSGFVQDARQLARNRDQVGDCTHSGMIQTWARMMTDPDFVQNRREWIDGDLRVSSKSDTIYFPGCLTYYQEVFVDLEIDGINIGRSAIKLLNALGIEPMVLADERCCGHDQYWQGDMGTFQQLAEINLELFKDSRAKRIITSCPECALTLKHTYPEYMGEHGLEVTHLVELVAESIDTIKLKPVSDSHQGRVTYQDPCRMGRFSGIYQQPRDILTQSGHEVIEMEHNRHSSICCGTSCWSTCGLVNKNIQNKRLIEARTTGAHTLVTGCIKCQIHLKCAQKDPLNAEELEIEVKDLTVMLAELL
jgi:Fe-S oxidoreductase